MSVLCRSRVEDGFGNGLALTLIGVVAVAVPGQEFAAAFGLAALLGLLVALVAPRTSAAPLTR